MKKLIIAAAVAVVAGGAFALDGYDFTATLKTTKGKMSGVQTTKYNLGVDQMGAFWYDDVSITNVTVAGVDYPITGGAFAFFAAATNTDTKTIKGVSGISSLNLVDKKGKALPTGAGYLAHPSPVQEALVKALAAKYDLKSDNTWCETVIIDDEGCYRVAGSAKISIALYTTNCCEIGGAQFTNVLNGVSTRYYNSIPDFWYALGGVPMTNENGVVVGIFPDFIQRFGALTSAKANKVEMLATYVPGFAGVIVPTTADGRWFMGSLAGQGTWSKGRVATVSGNIVGEMDPALCPHCCVLPRPAVAFDCDETDADDSLTTAAYGTFRLKYNSKL